MGYVLTNIIVWVVAEFDIVRVVGIVLEIGVMLDMMVEIVAIRFWGQYSFCCYKPGKKQNILFSLLIIVLLSRYIID